VSNTVYRNALKYCENKCAILLIDPPYDWIKSSGIEVPNYNEIEKVVGDLRHPNAALYYPRLKAQCSLNDGNNRMLVPCGAVAGVIARTDIPRGVWKAAAGLDANMIGISELELTLTEGKIEAMKLTNPHNAIYSK
jgi:uncharacterized protein